MKFRLEEIEERVFALLDENLTLIEERVEYRDPGTSPVSLVAMLLPDAARIILSSAPLAEIGDCKRVVSGLRIETFGNHCELTLPERFLRLIYFRMADWEFGVSTPLAFGLEEHRLRARAGRRASPAVAIRENGSDKRLEIYGTATSGNVAVLEYVEIPELKENSIDLPGQLFQEVCAKTAEMIRIILEQ